MFNCPYCGHNLPLPIIRGIASCNNCNRVFDSSPINRLLSVAWLVRRRHIQCRDLLVYQFGCTPDEADLVEEYVIEGGYSHEDFLEILRERCISEDYQICLDLAS
jgi:hypothetical protein